MVVISTNGFKTAKQNYGVSNIWERLQVALLRLAVLFLFFLLGAALTAGIILSMSLKHYPQICAWQRSLSSKLLQNKPRTMSARSFLSKQSLAYYFSAIIQIDMAPPLPRASIISSKAPFETRLSASMSLNPSPHREGLSDAASAAHILTLHTTTTSILSPRKKKKVYWMNYWTVPLSRMCGGLRITVAILQNMNNLSASE